MANKIYNKVTLIDVDDFKKASELLVDFNKLIPIPTKLEHNIKPFEVKLAYKLDDAQGSKFKMFAIKRVIKANGLELDEVYDMLTTLKELDEEYKCHSKLAWEKENWGSRSGIDYTFDPEGNTIEFVTGWTTPTKIFEKLSEVLNNSFEVKWFDEADRDNIVSTKF